jgi:transposase-like protein
MPPKKLSDSDKQEILNQYRHSDETTVTLAVQYGVSTSTISRFLKQSLAEPEYEALVQRKRSGGRVAQAEQEMLPGLALSKESAARIERVAIQVADLEFDPDAPPIKRQRRRVAGFISAEQLAASVAHLSQLEQAPPFKSLEDEALIDLEPDRFELNRFEPDRFEPDRFEPDRFESGSAEDDFEPDELEADELELDKPELDKPEPISPKLVLPPPKLARPLPIPKAAVFEDAEDDDDIDDLDDDDLDDLDDDDLDNDFDESDSFSSLDSMQLQPGGQLHILPLQETALPRTCYVVVDRSSELITRPLKDFADLGQIHSQETQEKTLPIFDNHRVAKRFLRRMQRIVKVPDGRVFQKVKPYLQAKGITHLLIDGQVYSLN